MKPVKKVIVIGLDGLEPTITEAMLAGGELPNLSKLRAQGSYSRVRTTYPAQTPVAWSTFATGTNPGGHGVFDFISRDPKTYLPRLALNHFEQKNAFLPPKAVNGRQGVPVWEILSKAGISSTILRHPLTFPPDSIRGRMLAGVGVPDIRGGLGTYTYYTSDENVRPEQDENVVQVKVTQDNCAASYLIGPRNPKTRGDFHFEISFRLEADAHRVTLLSAGKPSALELYRGQWSDWLQVKFAVGPLVSVRGMVRFYLNQIAPTFELYASCINFDPDAPLFPISSPPEYAQQLESQIGTYYTVGMAEEDAGLKNRRLGDDAFHAQCALVLREREAMMDYELKRQREGLFFCLFDTPDRFQHLFWRFREPDHPANRGEAVTGMEHVIEDHYRTLDAIVGHAMEYADPNTLMIVLSDHGMKSFQRGFNINTWLCEHGFLALKDGLRPGEQGGDFLRHIDWDRTRAYALGLGGVYLNLKGREVNGIVSEQEAASIKAGLSRSLTGLIDPGCGAIAIRSVAQREEIYTGPYTIQAPDLLLNFASPYRASWGTPLGGVPEGCFVDNDKKWGGDHCIDPQLVPGVLFMNRTTTAEQPGLQDLAPTILDALGVPRSPAMEGQSLLARV